MSDRTVLLEKIQKKEAELHSLEDKVKAIRIYVQALKDVMGILDQNELTIGPTPKEQTLLRTGSAMALAREAILKANRPLHINELLGSLGKDIGQRGKSSLASALSAYVRREDIFSRPAPNTFGLIELHHVARKGLSQPPANFGEGDIGVLDFVEPLT